MNERVSNPPKRNPTVAVIGAGMSGILAAIKLKEAGFEDFTLYERAERLGGTWRDNTYPGLSCDLPSHYYSYSFELNPEWTHLFSPGAEIRAYFERVARKYDIERRIRYGQELTDGEFHEGRWHLRAKDGSTSVADIVIAATGVLRDPVYPDIPGLASFGGACFHSARWDHSVNLDGKRVGIIGTGSTGIQIVPAIVDQVARLSLFQRTPQWILPMPNPAYTEAEKAEFRASPEKLWQTHQYWAKRFERTFARAVIGDEEQILKIAETCQRNLDENVHDPELKRKLTPNYRVACKRLVMSDSFYPAIQKPNAVLVTEGIACIEPGGVRTKDGQLHELDVLVCATGFDGHRYMRPMELTGPAGNTLSAAWAETTEAHRAVALPGFPNFFMLIGPHSPVGNFALISVSEMQMTYILQLMEYIRSGRCSAVAPKPEATSCFNQEIRAAMGSTIWVSGCKSWYLDKHGNPGTWPFTFDRFEADMQRPNMEEFELIA